MSAPVHVIDDEEDIVWAIRTLLVSYGIPTQSWKSGVDFLAAVPQLGAACCVLTDIRMAALDGIELTRQLGALHYARPVIVMTGHGDVKTAVTAMKAGAFDFIEKPFTDEVLIAAIQGAAAMPDRAGHPVDLMVSPEIAAAIQKVGTLSRREREVLERAMNGKSGKVIAYELGISPRTVEVHRLRLLARLGVGSLAEAVRLAVRAELGGARE
jgi:two-component system response regulator FixJ